MTQMDMTSVSIPVVVFFYYSRSTHLTINSEYMPTFATGYRISPIFVRFRIFVDGTPAVSVDFDSSTMEVFKIVLDKAATSSASLHCDWTARVDAWQNSQTAAQVLVVLQCCH